MGPNVLGIPINGGEIKMNKEMWAFIDYENIASLDGIDLLKFSKVYIFIGAKQNKINLGAEKIELLAEIHLLKLKATSPDNLDFHICYYLGKLDTLAESNIIFVVVSNDTGFDPLLKHLKENGRVCARQKYVVKESIIKPVQTKKIVSLIDEKQAELVQRLANLNDTKRPKTEKSLKNYVKSHLGLQTDNVGVQREFFNLVKSNLIKIEGNNVKYKL